MSDVAEPAIQRLAIDRIEVSQDDTGRLRPVTESGVQSLIASIGELGVIKDAIHVRSRRRAGTQSLVLMAGAHRLEAARRLGWETIPARVWIDVTDDFAQLMEIDDNLAGADLSALELSVFLAARKRVYERLHPETKAGVAGARTKHGYATDIMSFAESVSEKRELSARHIRRLVYIGQSLTRTQVADLAAATAPLKLKDLMALAKISEPDLRSRVVALVAKGDVTSVAEALERLGDTPVRVRPDKVDEAFMALWTLWKRAPKAAKRAFAEEVGDEVVKMMGEAQ